jgi:S1-C subfamily serine protease
MAREPTISFMLSGCWIAGKTQSAIPRAGSTISHQQYRTYIPFRTVVIPYLLGDHESSPIRFSAGVAWMAESQTARELDGSAGELRAAPQTSPAPNSPDPNPVCDSWAQVVQGVLAVMMFLGAVAMVRYYGPRASQAVPPEDLQREVHALTAEIDQLKQQQAMPATVLSKYRNSIGYIYGVYQVAFPNQRPLIRARVSGTGFLVASQLLATNRHVAEPWYGDDESEALIRRGAVGRIENLVIFFPNSPTPVDLTTAAVSQDSDVALLRVANANTTRGLPVLPLSKSPSSPGERVTVVGYPMGIAGMVAKSPASIYDRMAYRHSDINAASELAALSLIRPSATWGHLGDVVGNKLIYDAPTAHGGSGGPVFNDAGEVIGINSAFMDGFTGGTLGVSVESLRPLLEPLQRQR